MEKVNREKTEELRFDATTLIAQKYQIGATAYSEFRKQVGDVEFHGAFGNMQTIAYFLIGEVFKQRAEYFLFAAA